MITMYEIRKQEEQRRNAPQKDKAQEKSCESVIDYLETCYVGARAMDDVEECVRIARAIEAYNTEPCEDAISIDDIKAEITTEISDYEGCADFNEGIRFGLRTALEIIDKHISGKGSEE